MPYSPSDEIIFNGYDRPGIDFRFWNADFGFKVFYPFYK
jgi:hypothetical protein